MEKVDIILEKFQRFQEDLTMKKQFVIMWKTLQKKEI